METLRRVTLEKEYEGLEKFSMSRFEVDGIEYVNPNRTFENWMVSYKDELDDDDHPNDVGPKFIWRADWEISEQHWISCAVTVPIGHTCQACGERA